MIESSEFSADGKRLLVARCDDHHVSGSNGDYMDEVCRTISVIDVDGRVPPTIVEQAVTSTSGPPPSSQLLQAGRRSTAFAEADRSVLVEEFGGGEVRLYDLDTKKWRKPFGNGKQHSVYLAVSRNQEVVAAGDYTEVVLWNLKSGKELRRIVGVDRLTVYFGNSRIACSADGELVAIGDSEGVQLWRVSDGTRPWPLSTVPLQLNDLPEQLRNNSYCEQPFAFSPIGHTIAAASLDRIRLYDVDRKLLRELPVCGTSSIVFSSDGGKLAAVKGNEVVLVNTSDGRCLSTLRSENVISIAISPDGTQIAIGGFDGSVKLWKPGSTESPRQIVIPGRTNTYTWPLPFAALVIWAEICWCIWVRRNKIGRQTMPTDVQEVVHRE